MIRNLSLIAWTVWLEFIRRKDFYVVSIFSLLFVVGVVVTRIVGVDSASTAKFLMSFGLSLSYLLAAVLAVSMASRQLPAEIAKRTIQPLLAKPISRAQVLAGKALAITGLSAATLVLLSLIGYLPTPKSEEQSLAVLAQTMLLQVVSLGVLTVLAMALSLYVPAPVAALGSLAIFFIGGMLQNAFVLFAGRASSGAAWLAERLLSIVPDFSTFNHVHRFVEGQSAMGPVAFGSVILYGLVLAAILYAVAAWSLERKAI